MPTRPFDIHICISQDVYLSIWPSHLYPQGVYLSFWPHTSAYYRVSTCPFDLHICIHRVSTCPFAFISVSHRVSTCPFDLHICISQDVYLSIWPPHLYLTGYLPVNLTSRCASYKLCLPVLCTVYIWPSLLHIRGYLPVPLSATSVCPRTSSCPL